MVVIDHLYGAITIPEWLNPVVLSPELQRLRDVRLINTSSPSCSALSDVRRFTHTIGVFFLAARLWQPILDRWTLREARAFLTAVLLHDIGTPAFGHLLEYQLTSAKKWDHEQVVADIIKGTYHWEKCYHQIYFYKSLRLHQILEQIDVDADLVAAYIRGQNDLGKLLAGTIDVDNIDNVYRMAAHLGFRPNLEEPVALVDNLLPICGGPVLNEMVLPLLESWQNYRRRSYEILAFDYACLSGQAMLTDCFMTALEKEELREDHWFLTDDQLLQHLWECSGVKEIVQRFAVSDFYEQLFLGWYSCPKGAVDFRKPEQRLELSKALSDKIKLPCSLYVFYDSGTFSKRLSLQFQHHRANGQSSMVETVDWGQKSESTIVSVFTSRHLNLNSSERTRYFQKVALVLEEKGLPMSCLLSPPKRSDLYDSIGQRETHDYIAQQRLPF